MPRGSAGRREHHEPLREAGLDDRAILDPAQRVASYACVNRIAGALGVPVEPERGGPPGAD